MSKLKLTLWIPLLALTLATGGQSFAASIPVSYSFTGSVTSAVMSGTNLLLTGVAQGGVNGLNGVEFDTTDTLSFITGLDNGTFVLKFPDGDTAHGNLFEDDTAVNPATSMGPFTQMLTFTGGTGQYAGVSGVLNGTGFVFPDHYTSSGSGTLTAPGLVATPEPSTWLMVLSGGGALARFGIRRRQITQGASC